MTTPLRMPSLNATQNGPPLAITIVVPFVVLVVFAWFLFDGGIGSGFQLPVPTATKAIPRDTKKPATVVAVVAAAMGAEKRI